MQFTCNKSTYFILSFLFIMNCGKNNQKVYKQFDTINVSDVILMIQEIINQLRHIVMQT